MKRIVLAASLALALAAPALAQDATQTMPPEKNPTTTHEAEMDDTHATSGHSTTVYHGPHRYPMRTRGGQGDPRIVDHSADTLIVEPTRSTITVMPPPQ